MSQETEQYTETWQSIGSLDSIYALQSFKETYEKERCIGSADFHAE